MWRQTIGGLEALLPELLGGVTVNKDFHGFTDMEQQSINYKLDVGPEEDEENANGQ